MEEYISRNRAFLPVEWTRWLVDHQEGSSAVYVRYEAAWADAWPHVDTWFKSNVFSSGLDGQRTALF